MLTKRIVCFLSAFSVVSFFFIPLIFADSANVVINEVLPNPTGGGSEDGEYIELYNKSDQVINLTDWKLDDIEGSGTSPFVIKDVTIAGKGFAVFYKSQTNIGLNNSGGDDGRLVGPDGQEVDKIHYSSTHENVSLGRAPDGSSTVIELTSLSPGASNGELPTATPTIEPSPTNSPTPTKEPTPTKVPAPTKTPTPIQSAKTSTPTLSKSYPVNGSITISPSTKLVMVEKNSKQSSISSNTVLSESTKSATYTSVSGKTITQTPKKENKFLSIEKRNLPVILFTVGVVLITICGILLFKKYGKTDIADEEL
ncbi:MAG: hypothetical protein A2857_05850 [Candidatus Levybacteria bacterium RIFCSPHIGHO2_01_FULL_36_15]|nr:MAG: hypothetical protein A2857_05850 [Candidatus Levybacteria bacterium RIFCSPHIGHO2_01_FULL_36_15]OGH38417.1 MAG: hypothetical protein A2905_00650 [Candidatus Levybacteria bacterium RIFCSPLOWO2_01_FULL_36_10]